MLRQVFPCVFFAVLGFSQAVQISVANGQVFCEGLICPQATNRCSVDKNSTPDRQQIIVLRQCWHNSQLLAKDRSVQPNPGGQSISSHSESNVSAFSSNFNSFHHSGDSGVGAGAIAGAGTGAVASAAAGGFRRPRLSFGRHPRFGGHGSAVFTSAGPGFGQTRVATGDEALRMHRQITADVHRQINDINNSIHRNIFGSPFFNVF